MSFRVEGRGYVRVEGRWYKRVEGRGYIKDLADFGLPPFPLPQHLVEGSSFVLDGSWFMVCG